MDPGLVAVAEAGEQVPGSTYVEALLEPAQHASLTTWRSFMHVSTLLLTPTLPLPAFEDRSQHARAMALMARTGRAGRPLPTRSTSPSSRRFRCPAA